MIYTISDRDGFHHLLNDVLLIQPKTHQQGFGVVSLVESLSHTSWRYLGFQLKRVKHQTLVQRVNKQTFRCSGCPRPAWGKRRKMMNNNILLELTTPTKNKPQHTRHNYLYVNFLNSSRIYTGVTIRLFC